MHTSMKLTMECWIALELLLNRNRNADSTYKVIEIESKLCMRNFHAHFFLAMISFFFLYFSTSPFYICQIPHVFAPFVNLFLELLYSAAKHWNWKYKKFYFWNNIEQRMYTYRILGTILWALNCSKVVKYYWVLV